MSARLIIIEGLPGAGKSTVAEITSEVLSELKIQKKFFSEGNKDHPADYDGVAYLLKEQFYKLLEDHEILSELIKNKSSMKWQNFLVPYVKLMNEMGDEMPRELVNTLMNNDIYELPFELHIELLLDRWSDFVADALKSNSTYLFECCFIQNPITVSMIRDDTPKDITIRYIEKLAKIIEPLDPVLIYVDQNDLEASFMKIIEERPTEWLDGFTDYYTNQGIGKEKKLEGVEGTIEVLKLRKKLEIEIFNRLDMKKMILDNSSYNGTMVKKKMHELMENEFN